MHLYYEYTFMRNSASTYIPSAMAALGSGGDCRAALLQMLQTLRNTTTTYYVRTNVPIELVSLFWLTEIPGNWAAHASRQEPTHLKGSDDQLPRRSGSTTISRFPRPAWSTML